MRNWLSRRRPWWRARWRDSSQQIIRVEVHLSDENRHKGGPDKRCVMEARLEGKKAVAVTDEAEHMEQAVNGVAAKLGRPLNHELRRLNDR